MSDNHPPMSDPYSDPTLYAEDEDGHIILTARAFAALVGVTEEEMQKHLDAHGPRVENLPEDWRRAGARRSAEHRAATGNEDLHTSIIHFIEEEQR